MNLIKRTSLVIFLSLISMNLLAQTFSSGIKKIPLIELYTSEGCSSCPPADRWLSQLKYHSDLWNNFVPIAFHVNYWDYIGWSDPYASQTNSLRQRRYRQQGNTKGVYTPGFVFMGTEWRTWYLEKNIPKVDWSNVGELSVKIENNIANIQFSPLEQSTEELKIHLSVLGFDLISKVTRGENQGKNLQHEFVNLAHVKELSKPKNGYYNWRIKIPKKLKATASKIGYAVWVSGKTSQQPLQATGAWAE